MTNVEKKLNVWQKLVEVRKTIGYIKKEAQGYGYKYAKESDILLAISEEMNNQGLVLEQVPVSFESVPVLFKGKEVSGLRIVFNYIITDSDNPTDQIIRTQFMQQPGSDAQTIGCMMTYGMKYFLFKLFNVAMDDMDVDAIDKSKEDHLPIVNQKITTDQAVTISKMMVEAQCVDTFLPFLKKQFKIDMISDIPETKYDTILHLLTKKLESMNATI